MYVCVCIIVYVYRCMYACVFIYVYMGMYVYMRVYVCVHVYVCVCMYTCICIMLDKLYFYFMLNLHTIAIYFYLRWW